jgi:putative membrane protein
MNKLKFVAIAAIITFYGCTGAPPVNNQESKMQSDTNLRIDTAKTTDIMELNVNDQDFLIEAIRSAMVKIRMSDIIKAKAYNMDARDVANSLYTEQIETEKLLKDLAIHKHVMPPNTIGRELQDDVDDLSNSGGREIDHKYLQFMLSMYEKDLDHINKASASVKDEELKSYIGKRIPQLKNHIQNVKKVQEQLKNK